MSAAIANTAASGDNVRGPIEHEVANPGSCKVSARVLWRFSSASASRRAATTGHPRRAAPSTSVAAAPTAGSRPAGRTRRAAKTGAKSSSQWKKPCWRRSARTPAATGGHPGTASIGAAPAKARSVSSAWPRSSQSRPPALEPLLAVLVALARMAAEDHREGVGPLLRASAARRPAVLGQRPEPQRTPGVHDAAQPPVGAVRVGERLPRSPRVTRSVGSAGPGGTLGVGCPTAGCRGGSARRRSPVGASRSATAARTRWPRSTSGRPACGRLGAHFAPVLQRARPRPGRASLTSLRVGRRAPAVGGEQEVVDAAARSPATVVRSPSTPTTSPGPPSARTCRRPASRREHGAARTDERVAAAQVQAEPRRVQALDHGVEPERDLGELDGGGVEVDAVASGAARGRPSPAAARAGSRRGRSVRRAPPAGAVRYSSASWRTASIANAPEPRAGSQTVSSRISSAVVVRARPGRAAPPAPGETTNRVSTSGV